MSGLKKIKNKLFLNVKKVFLNITAKQTINIIQNSFIIILISNR